MKQTIIAAFVLFAATGCKTTAPDQQLERGKNVAKIERRGWRILDVLTGIATNIITTTATNYAAERLGNGRGLRK